MGRQSRAKQHRRDGTISTTDQGKLVEQIVGAMHEVTGVTAARNVRLPALRNPRRRREIDVLLTGDVAGYPVRIAIECKNERSVIGTPNIDAFQGKLNDIGIPAQLGVYVSVNGFTKGAVDRAQELGIKTLVLTGLTASRLAAEVIDAFQSVVYLLPEVVKITVANQVAATNDAIQMLVFRDGEGNLCGTAMDLIWQAWLDGQLPAEVGEHDLCLQIPVGWHQVIDGQPQAVVALTAQVRVLGLVIQLHGQASQHALVDAVTQTPERSTTNVSFALPNGPLAVTTAATASELAVLLRPLTPVRVVGHVRLPRIRHGPMYWPPSERTVRTMTAIRQAVDNGLIPDPAPISFAALEGTDLRAAWEPIWSEHPSMKR